VIRDLMLHTDSAAEIHKTLRSSLPVEMSNCEAREV